tara:strand:- start:794 stop:1633 length:840 start_codon:yes stop_codon:yes gene_type:complete
MKLICIPATRIHIKYVEFSLQLLSKSFPDNDILIVTPHPNSFNHLNKRNIVVRNDTEFLDLSIDEFKKELTDDKKHMFKWYYQQFLKYSIISKSKEYSDILILDADTIILSDCVKDINSINLTKLEYNKSYFELIKNHFPGQKLLSKSAIVNFMWFNSILFAEMLDFMVSDSKRNWFDILLEDINKSTPLIAFSEYETYANYKNNNKKSELKVLKIFRRADLFMDFYSFERIIEIAKIYKFDLISFEDNHKKSLFKKIIISLIVMSINLKLFLTEKQKF